MATDHSDDLHYLWLLGLACVALGLVYLLGPILTPFVFGAVLAYICNPLVDRLERRRVPRVLATCLVLLLLAGLFVLLLLILIPLFYKEAAMLAERLPGFLERASAVLGPWLKERFDIHVSLDPAALRQLLADNAQVFDGVLGKVFASLRVGGGALIALLLNLVLIPVVLFYLLRDWNRLLGVIDGLVPRRCHGCSISSAITGLRQRQHPRPASMDYDLWLSMGWCGRRRIHPAIDRPMAALAISIAAVPGLRCVRPV